MELLYISCYQFKKNGDNVESLPAYGNSFWEKYLDVFSTVHVLGEKIKNYLDNGTTSLITNPNVHVDIIPGNTNPKDFVNDNKIRKILESEIYKAEAILIKPSNRKGMMAIRLAEKYKKPFMIELTGDLKLTLRTHPNILKKMYAPIIHKQILSTIKKAPFGLYVTEKYLQKIYPIAGIQCGASDVCIDGISVNVLGLRLKRINDLNPEKMLNIGLIGSYHDKRKGIDTAIRAISLVNKEGINVFLNILALGTEDDRNKWNDYAENYNVANRLRFPASCESTQKVLEWIDTQDIVVLPSRSEGLPRCIVEAMSRGCPCITSNVCGMPELINNRWLHNPGDYAKLASLVIEMIKNKNSMVESAKENYQNSYRFLRENIKERRNSFLLEFKNYCEKTK